MIIQEVKVNSLNTESRFVLKDIKTPEGVFSNRKIAISNFMFNCEKDRMKYERPVFGALFQTHHIVWDSLNSSWDYDGLESAKEHANKNNRVFLTYQQRSDNQLNDLKLIESEHGFKTFLDLVDNVPFQLPINMGLNEWKKEKKKLILLLKPNQNLVPIVSSRHNVSSFPLIIKEEIGKSKIIGINSYELTTPKK